MASRLVVEILSDAKGFSKGFDSAKKELDGFSKKVDQTGSTFDKLRSRFDNMSASSKIAVAAAGAAFAAFAKDSIRAASDAGESINAVEKTFGSASETILTFSEVAAQAAGLSRTEFNTLATQTGALLTNFGFSAEQAANQSIRLTQRAADLASVFNTNVPDALNAVNAALRGETEPLRRYGVSLSDAAVRAKAVELGLADTTSAVDANGKAVAALELIYEQTSSAQGDFLQTSDSLANRTRQLTAEWENAKASFGQAALPVATGFLNRFSEGLMMIQSGFSETAAASLAFRRATENIMDAMKDGDSTALAFQDSLFFLAEETELTTGTLQALAAAAGVTIDDTDAFAESIANLARDMGYSEEVIQEVVDAILGIDSAAAQGEGALEGLGDEAATVSNKADSAARSLKNLADEIKAQTQPVFGALKAWQQYQDTISQIDEDGQRTSEELVTLAESAIDVIGAFGELSATDLDRAFETIGSAIGETADEARDLFRELGLFDGRQFTFQVTGIYETSGSAGDLGITLPSGVAARAAGGPVNARTPYLVGERGPELFIPPSSGYVMSNAQSFGSNVTINVTNPTTRDLDVDLARSALLAGLMTQVGG